MSHSSTKVHYKQLTYNLKRLKTNENIKVHSLSVTSSLLSAKGHLPNLSTLDIDNMETYNVLLLNIDTENTVRNILDI